MSKTQNGCLCFVKVSVDIQLRIARRTRYISAFGVVSPYVCVSPKNISTMIFLVQKPWKRFTMLKLSFKVCNFAFSRLFVTFYTRKIIVEIIFGDLNVNEDIVPL